MNKYEIDTPALVIDKDKLNANLELMQTLAEQAGKNLRPHIKTHKCSEIAQMQIKHGAIGVSAAKVSEALALAKNGIENILITSPVVTASKINSLLACRKLDHGLIVVCDSVGNSDMLNQAAVQSGLNLNVLVDIDPGIGRTGVHCDDAMALAQHIHQKCDALSFEGIQSYAGNLQHVQNYQQRKQLSLDVMNKAANLRNIMLTNGLPCHILTGSGTGTYDIDINIDAVTEVQPGSYTVMDVEYSAIGSLENALCFKRFQPAMTMLVTVISANRSDHVTVDAGTKAIYFDPNTKPLIISHPGLHYDWSIFGDEHGKITADNGFPLPRAGEVLELIVPHCDPTINLYDEMFLTQGDRVIDTLKIDARGKVN